MTHPHIWPRAAHKIAPNGAPDCRKRCAHPLAPSARGLRPQAVGERTVRLPEIFRAMARFSPSAPSGHRSPSGASATSPVSGESVSQREVFRHAVASCFWRGSTERSRPFPTNLPKVCNIPIKFFVSLRGGQWPPLPIYIGRTGAAGWAYWVSCADFCRALLRYSLGLVPSILRKHLEK